MIGNTAKNATLLIVEDEQWSRWTLTRILELKGYRVIAVADGRQALSTLQAGIVPNAILLDMLLPILDGWHFLDQLHDNPAWTSIPIIVMTGIVLSPEWAQDHGCAGFLKKPIEVDRLFHELRRCLHEELVASDVHAP
jgi:CheY-like chemotaxis protein